MLCCCERDEQTASRIMSDYNIDLGEWGVPSVPALMAKIAWFLYNKWIRFSYILWHILCLLIENAGKKICFALFVLTFVKGSALTLVTDKYSEYKAQASSAKNLKGRTNTIIIKGAGGGGAIGLNLNFRLNFP